MVRPIPHLPAYLDTSERDVNLWHVWCPCCRRWHTHGAGRKSDDPMELLGLRTAHCHVRGSPYDATGYNLVYGGRWADLPRGQRRYGPGGAPARRAEP